MEISIAKRQAYSEIYELINLMDIEYIDKIPKKLMNFFEENRDKNYHKNINPFQDIKSQNLNKDTLTIFSMINLKYFATEEEKEKLKNFYNENNRKLLEKYSANMFKQPEKPQIQEQVQEQTQVAVVEEENNIFKKFIKFLIKIFRKRD